MRFDSENRTMHVRACELVSLAMRRAAAVTLAGSEDGVSLATPARPTNHLVGEVIRGDLHWEISADAAVEGDTVRIVFPITGDPTAPRADDVRRARGEGFLAAYLLSRASEIARPQIRIQYTNGTETAEAVERPTADALARFIDRTLSSVEAHCEAEIDRVVNRLPSMKRVPFPFSSVRESQRELISACYRALARGDKLYACAPTGTGKTVSTLFPAVRALGNGAVDKIFYFTAKTTTAVAAAEAAKHLAKAGAELRVLMLSAKERICTHNLACREIAGDGCPLSRYAPAREDEAARDLLALGKTVVTSEELRRIGEERKLCPYELSLRYAQLADVVICDYNYLFDPRVALRRFFSEGAGGRWAFLIDEAHNLVERSRELYSLELPLAELERFRPIFSKNPALNTALTDTICKLRAILAPIVADSLEEREGMRRGFARQSEMPPGLLEALGELLARTEGTLAAHKLSAADTAELTRHAYDLRAICEKLTLYSSRYTSFIMQNGDALTYRALCLDPSEILARRLALGAASILFSATLTPTDYYCTVLGGDGRSDRLDLPSPFDPERLCVAVLDRISTRYTDREGSLLQVARAILTAVKAKPGNYMVFCPSFTYLDALAEAIARLAPRLPLVRQSRHMTAAARAEFLAAFSEENRSALIGLCVLGGIFGEGIDLAGRRLIGSIVIGVGLPQPTPEREAIREYYEDTLEAGREYAYHYPGMNRVLQAAGRVIRREDDRGVILLIDDRFSEPLYREMVPAHWRGLKYVGDLPSLTHLLTRFWKSKA